ncbi:hypothetical protein TD95_000355 [Thielaviopsis punctulata]|uniref:N-acetyltransferase domain-containing protein n=1 Tax=Thielaviopsis punctulata TaxID=72032 RepID=A0A0F4Z6V0_9PEZI|nr:hypothetical protein TD95_000355 [Thielaviopsis punctulata]
MGKVTITTTLPKRPYQALADRPAITTARLTLRAGAAEHESLIHRLRTQEEVMVWSSAGCVDADMAATHKSMSAWLPPNDRETWNWVVFETETGAFVGTAGNYRRVGSHGWPELGYMLVRESWGKGYATEILRAFVESWWALPREQTSIEVEEGTCVVDGQLGKTVQNGDVVEEVLMAVIDVKNDRSANVLRKLGFEKAVDWQQEDKGVTYNLATMVMKKSG